MRRAMEPPSRPGSGAHRGAQLGFTYIGLLIAVFVMGLLLAAAGRVWSLTERRERELQLLWEGHAIRKAISSYYANGHQFPAKLEELLQDERFPIPKHHLRRLYADPLTGKTDWILIMSPGGEGIMGVASSSKATPIKRAGFDPVDDAFKDADCYCLWQFVYYPNRYTRAVGPAATTPNPSGGLGTFQPGKLSTLTPSPGGPAPGNINPMTPGGLRPLPPEDSSTLDPDSNTGPN